jgi:hypothetical protein
MNHCTDYKSQVKYKEPLDWETTSTQDDESSDEDSISNELAAMAGLSCLLLTPALTRRFSHASSSRLSKYKESREKLGGLGVMTRITTWIAMHIMIMATIG